MPKNVLLTCSITIAIVAISGVANAAVATGHHQHARAADRLTRGLMPITT